MRMYVHAFDKEMQTHGTFQPANAQTCLYCVRYHICPGSDSVGYLFPSVFTWLHQHMISLLSHALQSYASQCVSASDTNAYNPSWLEAFRVSL
jgi:hypothetical protein